MMADLRSELAALDLALQELAVAGQQYVNTLVRRGHTAVAAVDGGAKESKDLAGIERTRVAVHRALPRDKPRLAISIDGDGYGSMGVSRLGPGRRGGRKHMGMLRRVASWLMKHVGG